ncbi:Fur family transcriptional regulator [Citroniella saccharovorans]|uniref:Fur family transcriptional regulator n=1 Tax=Citroniella saccharovorans TaxID=2053367 RepID=A0AAW9MRX9_9FIRM|nr:Fur family transcriptional regulator [Citroniella saccharovorans]MEB3428725.1 Fur family transcriptional regulator [Citroniella saccharovorans]
MVRMTRIRRLIYEILKDTTMPLSCLEVRNKLLEMGADVFPSTVYRTMEFFEENNMVLKADLPGSLGTYYILKEDSHKHFAICLNCKKKFEIKGCPVSDTIETEDENFKITSHKFMVFGYCSDCSKNN